MIEQNPYWITENNNGGFCIKSSDRKMIRNIGTDGVAYRMCSEMNKAFQTGFTQKGKVTEAPFTNEGPMVMNGIRAVCIMNSEEDASIYSSDLNNIFWEGVNSEDRVKEVVRVDEWDREKRDKGWD